MTYIITALFAEASALIEELKLEKNQHTPFPIYKHKDIVLIISGIGKINAASATTYLLQKYTPHRDDKLYNIGTCTSKENNIPIGTLVKIKKLLDKASASVYHLSHGEKALTCVDKAVSNTQEIKTAFADMESIGVYVAAKRFISSEQIAIIKIVSDYTDSTIPQAEDIKMLFANNKALLGELFNE